MAGVSSSNEIPIKGSLSAAAFTSTLEEPVSATIMRDFRLVGSKLRTVLVPTQSPHSTLKELRDWDLWGPLLVCLSLSIMLSIVAPESQSSLVFTAVFVVVWVGAAVVTLNALLLGGKISFFQSLCVLGYCVFPLDIACFLCLCFRLIHWNSVAVRVILVIVAFAWSTKASVVFMSQMVPEERKLLAVYPVFLFYLFVSWMVISQ